MLRDPAVVASKGTQRATVLFFHGLGDQGDGWASSFTQYNNHINESRPVTLNMGIRMPAWFDIKGLTPECPEDDEGIERAKRLVHDYIDKEVAAGIPPHKIIVAGFSMGGALALYAGLTYPQKLGGIAGLSSFLVQRQKIPATCTANLQTRIFLAHGHSDLLIPFEYAQLTHTHIKAFNNHTEFHDYQIGHESSPLELKAFSKWILQCV